MRLLQVLALGMAFLMSQGDLHAQYLHYFDDDNGNPVKAAYWGNANWLADQKDPRSHLHDIKTLGELQLLDHDVTVAEMRYVKTLSQLRSLVLGQAPEGATINDEALAVLSECNWIEFISIGKEDLKDSDLKHLEKLPNLTGLEIEGSDLIGYNPHPPHGLSERAVDTLVKMKSLDFLSLRGDTGFTDQSIEELAALPNLEYLDITSSKFTDEALRIIGAKMNLRYLRINSPQFTEEGIQAFKQKAEIKDLLVSRYRL